MKLYGGNCLETPVYWYRIEPEMDCYDFSMVKDVIEEAREAGLHLILLWFGTSKNGHPNYVPEYIKLQPDIYRLAQGPTGRRCLRCPYTAGKRWNGIKKPLEGSWNF